MKKLMRTFCFMITAASALFAADTAPSISIGNVINYINFGNTQLTGRDTRLISLRGQLIAELAGDYHCNVQTRWQGFNVATEGSVSKMSHIADLQVPASQIQISDYLVGGNFTDTKGGSSIKGYAICIEIQNPKNTLEMEFVAGSVHEVPERMAEAVAKLLHLRKCSEVKGIGLPIAKSSTLLICPFVDMSGKNLLSKDFTLHLELALQENGHTKLVDRQSLNSTLREHNLSSIDDSSASASQYRQLAHLVSAEIIIMGHVSTPYRKQIQLDLFMVCAKSGAILASQPVFGETKRQLLMSARKGVVALSERPVLFPAIKVATEEAKNNEARLLTSRRMFPTGDFSRFTWYKHDDVAATTLDSTLNGAEGAYLLTYDRPGEAMKVIRYISGDLRHHQRQGGLSTHRARKTRSVAIRAAYFIDSALAQLNSKQFLHEPTLMRAEALMSTPRFMESIDLAEEYLGITQAEMQRAYFVLAVSHYKAENFEQTQKFLRIGKITSRHSICARYMIGNLEKRIAAADIRGVTGNIEKYEAYQELFMNEKADTSWNDLTQYLKLMREVKGAEYGLSVTNSGRWKCEVLSGPYKQNLWQWNELRVKLHKAECLAKLPGNRLPLAATYAKAVIDSIQQVYESTPHRYREINEMIKEAYAFLERENGQEEAIRGFWKDASETMLLPERYSIYFQPVGSQDEEFLRQMASSAGRYFGRNIKMLPAIEPSSGVLRSGAEKNGYNPKPLMYDTLKIIKVPNDALLLYIITKEAFGYGNTTAPSRLSNKDKNIFNPVITSYRWFLSPKKRAQKSMCNRATRKLICAFHYISCKKKNSGSYGNNEISCNEFPCIFSTYLHMSFPDFILPKMCPTCQEEYKKVDFNKIHNDLMKYLKKNGAKIVDPSEVEFQEIKPQNKKDEKAK